MTAAKSALCSRCLRLVQKFGSCGPYTATASKFCPPHMKTFTVFFFFLPQQLGAGSYQGCAKINSERYIINKNLILVCWSPRVEHSLRTPDITKATQLPSGSLQASSAAGDAVLRWRPRWQPSMCTITG